MKTLIRALLLTFLSFTLFQTARPGTVYGESPAASKAGSGLGGKLDDLKQLFGDRPQPDPANTYIRYEERESGSGVLQLRDVTFTGPGGQKLELTGAIHIGDKAYYESLNAHLKQFDCVLFEVVAAREIIAALQMGEKLEVQPGQGVSLAEIYKLLADDILQLASQMELMDYTLPAMVHADFTDVEFAEALKQQGLDPGALTGGLSPWKLKLLLSAVKLFIPRDDPAAVKRLMAPVVGLAAAGSQTGNSKLDAVIITARNQRVIEVLDAQISSGKKNLSIFYGAGHFPDLVERLKAKGWRQTGEAWRTAWEIPVKPELREAVPPPAESNDNSGPEKS